MSNYCELLNRRDARYVLVAAFNPFINVATDHLAGARNGAKVARVHGTGKISLALCRKVPVGMGKGAAHADHNAS